MSSTLSTINVSIFTTVLMIVINGLFCTSEKNSRHLHTLEFWLAYFAYFGVSYLTQHSAPGIVALSCFVWIWRTKAIVTILSDVTKVKLWKNWYTIVLAVGYVSGVLLYFAGLEFHFFTMPPAIANFVIGLDLILDVIKKLRLKKDFSIPHKLLVFNVFIIFLHLLDYPFLRYDHRFTGLGFAIVLVTTILMAVVLPAVSFSDLEKSYKEEVQNILQLRVRQLKEQAKFSALGEVTAGIVHEINHPMSIISDRASHLRHQVLKDKASKDVLMKDLNQIELISERMNKVLHSLKKFSESSQNEPLQIVAVATIVEDTLSYCADRFHQANILLDVEPYPPVDVECRPAQISQVLLNLLNNSFEAVQSKNNPWVRIVFIQEKSGVKIKVIDSGAGIPEVNRRKIMEPFFTTKTEGSIGLGLSISQSIMDAHKGRLSYDETGPNTSFIVELPYRQS